jgi:hypothetical protein
MEGSPTSCLEKFIEFKIKQGRRPAYTSDLKSRCLRFIQSLPPNLPAKAIMPEHIQAHLNSPPGEMTQRDNQYRNLGAWLRWAAHHGWIGSDPMPPKLRGMAAKASRGEAVIFSPSQAKTLLETTLTSNDNGINPCGLDVMPFVALSLFAGIRPAEFRKRVHDKKASGSSSISIGLTSRPKGFGFPRNCPKQDWLESFHFTKL